MESSSSTLSLVSRAKTALHSAAAKAEKVLTDIKADLKSDRESDGQSHRGSKRSTEQETGRAGDPNKTREEFRERDSIRAEDASETSNKLTIPPAYVIRQLAVAVECVKNFKSVKDLMTLVGDLLPNKEKTGLSFSVVKSLVLREKEENPGSGFCEEELQSLLHSLFSSEDHIAKESTLYHSATLPMVNLPKDIRGAPLDSFVVRLSEIIGGLKSLQKMALFWHCVVDELRRLWLEGQPIARVPLDANPDLNSCLLHQQLQVINCCIARKHRKNSAIESLDAVLQQAIDSKVSDEIPEKLLPNDAVYARIDTGGYILRLGADHPSEDLMMLETGEPVFSPVTQEGPVLTEELIKETEEFVLRTRSVGAGCSQLLSDMQAFKAANPGCILEDFIRWHSPPDWMNMESEEEPNDLADAEASSSRRGRLSRRMQKEGNLWRELWETAKPLPAVKQTPLFDEDLAVDSILTILEDISPSDLFEQLFVSVLWSGFLIAEAALPQDSNLSEVFYKCKDYVTVAYQSGTWNENITDICKVYETVETILLHPEEAVMIMEQPDETILEEPKRHFKKINLNFMNKDKQSSHKGASKEEKKSDEKHSNVFSNLFDKKVYLFSKKNPKSKDETELEDKHSHTVTSSLQESDWTIV